MDLFKLNLCLNIATDSVDIGVQSRSVLIAFHPLRRVFVSVLLLGSRNTCMHAHVWHTNEISKFIAFVNELPVSW